MSFTDSLFIQFKQSSQREFVDLVCLGIKQKNQSMIIFLYFPQNYVVHLQHSLNICWEKH